MSLQDLLNEIDDYEIRQEQALMKYRNLLEAHPHCDDPDHPGCSLCYDEPDDDPRP